jgi:hypothetical protein
MGKSAFIWYLNVALMAQFSETASFRGNSSVSFI